MRRSIGCGPEDGRVRVCCDVDAVFPSNVIRDHAVLSDARGRWGQQIGADLEVGLATMQVANGGGLHNSRRRSRLSEQFAFSLSKPVIHRLAPVISFGNAGTKSTPLARIADSNPPRAHANPGRCLFHKEVFSHSSWPPRPWRWPHEPHRASDSIPALRIPRISCDPPVVMLPWELRCTQSHRLGQHLSHSANHFLNLSPPENQARAQVTFQIFFEMVVSDGVLAVLQPFAAIEIGLIGDHVRALQCDHFFDRREDDALNLRVNLFLGSYQRSHRPYAVSGPLVEKEEDRLTRTTQADGLHHHRDALEEAELKWVTELFSEFANDQLLPGMVVHRRRQRDEIRVQENAPKSVVEVVPLSRTVTGKLT